MIESPENLWEHLPCPENQCYTIPVCVLGGYSLSTRWIERWDVKFDLPFPFPGLDFLETQHFDSGLRANLFAEGCL